MNSGEARVRLTQAGVLFAAFALIAGCGDQYRPVVTPVNPSGPAAQPNSLAVVVSAPSVSAPGIATVIDYSGDTVMAQATIGPGPVAFTVDETGSNGYTLNSDGTLTNFSASTTLQTKNVTYSTLPSGSQTVGFFSPSAGLWAADQCATILGTSGCQSAVDVMTGVPETLKLSVPVAPTPVTVAGSGASGERYYAISQNTTANQNSTLACNAAPFSGADGEADAIETSLYTVSAKIPLGICPVYALASADNRRTFVLNRGDDTITVINSQNNTLDSCTPFVDQSGQTVSCHPTLPLSTTALAATSVTPPNCTLASDPTCGGMPTIAGPVYAEYNTTTSQLVVADYDGGTISIIDVSLDEYGNDSATFGTTYTVKVGNTATPYPASVTVLADGTNTPRAYTANQAEGTVTIVNVASHTVEKTLTGVNGHPRTVVSTVNSLYGKVYVSSPDSPYLTIIRTDQDIVDTVLLVPGGGNLLDVRVTTQTGSSGNSNNTSRIPGYGQPCYLPPALEPAPTGTQTALQVCQTLPTAQ